jgi:hypothetical protein
VEFSVIAVEASSWWQPMGDADTIVDRLPILQRPMVLLQQFEKLVGRPANSRHLDPRDLRQLFCAYTESHDEDEVILPL